MTRSTLPAPGYQSFAWTTQDWRTVRLHGDGSWTYADKCGVGSTLPTGRKRLCLPRHVLDVLSRTAEGRAIIRQQAERKQAAGRGVRAPWHPRIADLVSALDARTVADAPRRNPEAFTPPPAVRRAAARGLHLRASVPPSRRGGTAVGLARARDLANGRPVSLDTIRRMRSFFARHDVDKRGSGFYPDEPGYPSKGVQAWLLWGGDPGRRWCERIWRGTLAAPEEDR